MRLRNIPGAAEAVAGSPFVIQDPFSSPASADGADALHIEIGMGKGQFLFALAAQNPGIRYIGIERYTSVLLRAVQKAEDAAYEMPGNLSFICADAAQVEEMFLQGAVDRIYLNFSDPWPKKRHADRRLTSRRYLSRYRVILSDHGTVEMKTDNQELFQFTLEELAGCGWTILAQTRDLHNDPVLSQGNCLTEYEEKFAGQGHPICKVIASPHNPDGRMAETIRS